MTTLKQRIGQYIIPKLPVNAQTFNQIRFELAAARTRLKPYTSLSAARRIRRLKQSKNIKVNIGSRLSDEGWISLDIKSCDPHCIEWDIRKGLPFSDSSVDLIYASHVIEHLEFRKDAPCLLADCYRVLSPHGSIRVVVPDVERFIRAYSSKDPHVWESLGFETMPLDMPTPMCLLNHVFHQDGEHQFGYDAQTLAWLLESSGFKKIELSSYRQSVHFPPSLDLPVHQPYSLYMDASK